MSMLHATTVPTGETEAYKLLISEDDGTFITPYMGAKVDGGRLEAKGPPVFWPCVGGNDAQTAYGGMIHCFRDLERAKRVSIQSTLRLHIWLVEGVEEVCHNQNNIAFRSITLREEIPCL